MSDILEISASSHRNELCQGISRLLYSEDDVGSDFEFSWADSTPIKAHFFVLQIFCRVLQSSNCRRICFESSEIQREDVRCLLEFIYRGKTWIKVDRLDAVKRAAVKLRLETFLDLVEGKQVKTVEEEVTIENETDTENEEELCESFAEDEDNVEEDEDSNSVDRDYTEGSEEEEVQTSNVGKLEKNGSFGKHLAPKKYNLRSYQRGNAQLATKHQVNSNGQELEKRVKCDLCEYTCAGEVLLKTHIKSAHNCASDKDELKRRKRSIHSKKREHACETCGKCFQTAGNLRCHQRMHAEKVDCEMCGKKFSMNFIYRHRKTHEVGQTMKRVSCIICTFRTSNRLNLKFHLKNIHRMSEGKIASLFNSHAGWKI